MDSKSWPCQESNLNLEFRKLLFYPLNYRAGYAGITGGWYGRTGMLYKFNLIPPIYKFEASALDASVGTGSMMGASYRAIEMPKAITVSTSPTIKME
jgi:hypothetical protein